MKKITILIVAFLVALGFTLSPASAAKAPQSPAAASGHFYPLYGDQLHCQSKAFHYSNGKKSYFRTCLNGRFRVKDNGHGIFEELIVLRSDNCNRLAPGSPASPYQSVTISLGDPSAGGQTKQIGNLGCYGVTAFTVDVKGDDHYQQPWVVSFSVDTKGPGTVPFVFKPYVCESPGGQQSPC